MSDLNDILEDIEELWSLLASFESDSEDFELPPQQSLEKNVNTEASIATDNTTKLPNQPAQSVAAPIRPPPRPTSPPPAIAPRHDGTHCKALDGHMSSSMHISGPTEHEASKESMISPRGGSGDMPTDTSFDHVQEPLLGEFSRPRLLSLRPGRGEPDNRAAHLLSEMEDLEVSFLCRYFRS